MSRIEQLRPKLKPCSVTTSGHRIVLECATAREPLVLPRSAAAIIPLFDGTRAVQQIVDQLHREQGHVEFHLLFSTIERLSGAGFLETTAPVPPSHELSVAVEIPQDRSPLFFRRVLGRRILKPRLGGGKARLPLFVALALTLLLGGVGFVVDSFSGDFISNGFPRFSGSYTRGALFFPVAISLLTTLRYALSAAMLWLATGRLFNLSLAVTPIAIFPKVDDTSMALVSQRWVVGLFHLASAVSYLALAGLFGALASTLPVGHPIASTHAGLSVAQNLPVIALFLFFLDLTPYARSELTKLFAALSPERLLPDFIPFLRNRSLLAFASIRESIPNEKPLILYSAIAIVWNGLFLSLTLFVADRCVPGLFRTIVEGAKFRESCVAVLILGCLALFLISLTVGLARLVFGNLLFPLASLMAAINGKFAARKSTHPGQEAILNALRSTSLFQGASGAILDQLLRSCVVRGYGRGAALLVQGRLNQKLFVLLEGSVAVFRRAPSGTRTRLAVLESGAVLGEVSAIEGSPATADVVTMGKCRVLEIPRASLKATSKDKALSPDLEAISAKVLLGQCIASSPLFKNMPSEVATFLSRRGVLKTVPAATAVTTQGDLDRTLFLLVRGQADVMKDGKKVATLPSGSFFGEIALIAGVPRTASVVTAAESILLSINADDVWNVLTKNPALSLYFETVADARREGRAEAA